MCLVIHLSLISDQTANSGYIGDNSCSRNQTLGWKDKCQVKSCWYSVWIYNMDWPHFLQFLNYYHTNGKLNVHKPVAKKRNATANRSASGILFLIDVSCFLIVGPTFPKIFLNPVAVTRKYCLYFSWSSSCSSCTNVRKAPSFCRRPIHERTQTDRRFLFLCRLRKNF